MGEMKHNREVVNIMNDYDALRLENKKPKKDNAFQRTKMITLTKTNEKWTR